MYENKLEFPGRRGGGWCKIKNLQWGEYGYFLELHNLISGKKGVEKTIKLLFGNLGLVIVISPQYLSTRLCSKLCAIKIIRKMAGCPWHVA